jgi:DNA-binding transcriptional regulator YiaG
MAYQFLRNVQIKRAVTGEIVKYAVVQGNEPVQVREWQTEVVHQYWVPASADLTDETAYLAPIDDPDYNLRRDFQLYREHYQLLVPAEIKKIRVAVHLSVQEYALVLGMDWRCLHDIEEGLVLQSHVQESLFRLSQDTSLLRALLVAKEAVLPSETYGRLLEKLAMDSGDEHGRR